MNQLEIAKAAVIEKRSRITVGELIHELKGYDPSTEVIFGSTVDGDPLIFYRVKNRGDIVQIELNEVNPDYIRNSAGFWQVHITNLL